jgi:hypothetical protein
MLRRQMLVVLVVGALVGIVVGRAGGVGELTPGLSHYGTPGEGPDTEAYLGGRLVAYANTKTAGANVACSGGNITDTTIPVVAGGTANFAISGLAAICSVMANPVHCNNFSYTGKTTSSFTGVAPADTIAPIGTGAQITCTEGYPAGSQIVALDTATVTPQRMNALMDAVQAAQEFDGPVATRADLATVYPSPHTGSKVYLTDTDGLTCNGVGTVGLECIYDGTAWKVTNGTVTASVGIPTPAPDSVPKSLSTGVGGKLDPNWLPTFSGGTTPGAGLVPAPSALANYGRIVGDGGWQDPVLQNEWYGRKFASLNALVAAACPGGTCPTPGTAVIDAILPVSSVTTVPPTLTLAKRGAGRIDCSVATKAITAIVRSGTTVTVTTSAPHGFLAGQTVTIDGIDPVSGQANWNQIGLFNGTFVITGTPLATTFTYTSVGNAVSGNVASVGGATATLKILTIQGPLSIDPGDQLFVNSRAGAVSFAGNSMLSEVSPQWWGAVGDGQQIDAAVSTTNTDTLVTIPSGSGIPVFTSADVGKFIAINDPSNPARKLYTTIASFVDAQNVRVPSGTPLTWTGTAGAVIWGTNTLAAFDAMVAAVNFNGGGAIYIPPGTYLYADGLPHQSTAAYLKTLTREGSFLTFRGAGKGKTVLVYPHNGGPGIRMGLTRADVNRGCSGSLPLNPPTSCLSSVPAFGVANYKPFNVAKAGDTSITLTNSADASAFAIGDWIHLESDTITTVPNGAAAAFYEYRRIVGISGAVLSLDQALVDTYNGLNANYPRLVAPIPFVPTGNTVRDLTIRGAMGSGALFGVFGSRQTLVENVELLNGHVYPSNSEDTTFRNCLFQTVAADIDDVPTEFVDDARRLVLDHNTFISSSAHPTLSVTSKDGRIINNTIYQNWTGQNAVRLSGWSPGSPAEPVPTHTLMSGNTIYSSFHFGCGISTDNTQGEIIDNNWIFTRNTDSSSVVGICLEGVLSDLTITNNHVVSLSPTAGIGLRFHPTIQNSVPDVQAYITVKDNFFQVPEFGIQNTAASGGTVDNVTLGNNTILGASTPYSLGTITNLDDSRTYVKSNANNTWTAVQDFTGATLLLPKSAGCAPSTEAQLCLDSTGDILKFHNGATAKTLATVDQIPTTNFQPALDMFWFQEEFLSGGITSGAIGSLGWVANNINGGTPAFATTTVGISNIIGMLSFRTPASPTAGQGGTLDLGGTASTNGIFPSLGTNWDAYLRWALVQTADTRFRAGLITDVDKGPPLQGIWIRYDTNANFGDTTTNWVFVCSTTVGSQKTIAASGAVRDTASSTVTITTTAPHGFAIGNKVRIAGVPVGTNTFNGTFTIVDNAPLGNTSQFTYSQAGATETQSGGTADAAAEMTANSIKAVNTSPHTLHMSSTVLGTVNFSVDGEMDVSINTNCPTSGKAITPAWQIMTDSTVQKLVNLDAYNFRQTGLSR